METRLILKVLQKKKKERSGSGLQQTTNSSMSRWICERERSFFMNPFRNPLMSY